MRDLRHLPKLVGAKQSKKALDDGQATALIVARDAQQTVTAPLVEQAARQNLPVEWADSMKELGLSCGSRVGAAVVALLR